MHVTDDRKQLCFAEAFIHFGDVKLNAFIVEHAAKSINVRLHVGRGDKHFTFHAKASVTGRCESRYMSSAMRKSPSVSMSIASAGSIWNIIGRRPIRL